MTDFLLSHGLAALFAVSFLASSLVPVGSEWLLAALLLQGHTFWPVVLLATLGNYLGACTTYGIGLWGGDYLAGRLLRLDERQRQRAERLYQRYGSWSLLFSWLPVIGDPLCFVAGSLRYHFFLFSLLVAAGKLARYAAVALVTLGAL